ncbi:hypothetical protein ACET3Z_010291 [Daucus carota]
MSKIYRERWKQANRESARRSGLRKQEETMHEELAIEVDSLTAENMTLKPKLIDFTRDFPSGSCNRKLIGARHFAASTITRGIFNATQDYASPLMVMAMNSLAVLKHGKAEKEGMITKTSIILGIGESEDELKEAMADFRAIDADILTLGQHLQRFLR